MATFQNQATLTYTGGTINSNIAYGEILEVLSATKTVVEGSYIPGERVTYAVALRNTGTAPFTALTLTDNLGATPFGAGTVYPLTLIPDSVRLFVNGVQQGTPTITPGPPTTVTPITVPAGGDAVVVYQALVNEFADPSATGSIVNAATITGGGLTAPISADVTLPSDPASALTVTKSITPNQVVDNGQVTYTFVIANTGNDEVDAADNVVVTDTFDPILTGVSATFNSQPFTAFAYNDVTGLFTTTAGAITVPAATVTQDPTTGAYSITPGIATLTVTGTI